MIKAYVYNFTRLRQLIDAAEQLQLAGKSEDCDKILKDLAKEIDTP